MDVNGLLAMGNPYRIDRRNPAYNSQEEFNRSVAVPVHWLVPSHEGTNSNNSSKGSWDFDPARVAPDILLPCNSSAPAMPGMPMAPGTALHCLWCPASLQLACATLSKHFRG